MNTDKTRRWLDGLALWWLRRSGYWTRINLLQGVERVQAEDPNFCPGCRPLARFRSFVAWEAGRHHLVMQLIEKHTDKTNTKVKQ
jgi:hypothetical protein